MHLVPSLWMIYYCSLDCNFPLFFYVVWMHIYKDVLLLTKALDPLL